MEYHEVIQLNPDSMAMMTHSHRMRKINLSTDVTNRQESMHNDHYVSMKLDIRKAIFPSRKTYISI